MVPRQANRSALRGSAPASRGFLDPVLWNRIAPFHGLPRRRKTARVPGLAKKSSRSTVCLFSLHPLLASESQRLLSRKEFRLMAVREEAVAGAPADSFAIPRAAVYIVEAQPNREVTHSIVSAIRFRYPKGRILVVAEKFDEANAFPLLQLTTKGLLRYSEVADSLERAVRTVVAGGFWVPRSLLSRFVDSTLEGARRPRFAAPVRLSTREREVVALLLENRSNKEIAGKLNMSERTAKFHVSNLLAKYGVKRRADLILLSFGQAQPA